MDACQLFDTLQQILEKEPALDAALRSQAAGQRVVVAQMHVVSGLQRQVGAARLPELRAALDRQLNAARERLRQAERGHEAAAREVDAAQRQLQPLYDRLRPNLEPWIRCDRELREYFSAIG